MKMYVEVALKIVAYCLLDYTILFAYELPSTYKNCSFICIFLNSAYLSSLLFTFYAMSFFAMS